MTCLSVALTLMALLLVMPSLVSGQACNAKYKQFRPSHSNCQPPDPAAKLMPLGQSAKNQIVRLHNEYRMQANPPAKNMMKMHWDEALATSAMHHMMRCTDDHDEMYDRMEPDWPNVKIGQNLGMGHRNFKGMLTRFWTEPDRLNYTYGEEYKDGIGHYYQMATARTTRVGCAVVKCPFGKGGFITWRACNYAPALNAALQPYVSGDWCADCPGKCAPNKKLCECGKRICMHGGSLNPATCSCTCKGMYKGDNCETLDCFRNDPENCERHDPNNCGKLGFVRDPNMCPHLCGVCQQCKGVVCQNGGKLNYTTCKCDCPKTHDGDTCGTLVCPTKDYDSCNTMVPREHCVESSSNSPAPTFKMCPIFCRKCATTCEFCENHGILITKPTCKCICKGGFTGKRCEICPKGDMATCGDLPKEWCYTPNMAIYFQTNCPYHCGNCTFPARK